MVMCWTLLQTIADRTQKGPCVSHSPRRIRETTEEEGKAQYQVMAVLVHPMHQRHLVNNGACRKWA